MFIVTLSDVLGLVIFGVIILAIVLFFGVEKTKDYIKEKSKTTQNVAKKTETEKDPKEEKSERAANIILFITFAAALAAVYYFNHN